MGWTACTIEEKEGLEMEVAHYGKSYWQWDLIHVTDDTDMQPSEL